MKIANDTAQQSTDQPFIDHTIIQDLADVLTATGLTEIEVAKGDFKVRVVKAPASVAATVAPSTAPAAAPVTSSTPSPVPTDHPGAVLSPMVGNVYLAPRPGADNFVKAGDSVQQGDTLLIIEAMKVMNPIPAPKSGTVKEILVSDADPVEFNAPLLIIE